jgi:hypothetical protein
VYPLCKAVAVCCLPSPCPDMNVTLGSLIFSGALLLGLLAASLPSLAPALLAVLITKISFF